MEALDKLIAAVEAGKFSRINSVWPSHGLRDRKVEEV